MAGWLTGYAPQLLIGPVITASLVTMINVRLAAILLTIELFDTLYIVPSLIALVVAWLTAQHTTIYRTQRNTDLSREIFPGFRVRRIPVPSQWVGRTLSELNVRARCGVNVVGVVSVQGEGNLVDLTVPVSTPLSADELLIVIGREADVQVLSNPESPMRVPVAVAEPKAHPSGQTVPH